MDEEDKNALEDAAKEIMEEPEQSNDQSVETSNPITDSTNTEIESTPSEPTVPPVQPATVITPSPSKKKFGKKKMILIFGSILIVVIVAVASYLLFFNKDEQVQQSNTEQQTANKEEHPEEVILPTVPANATAVWAATPTTLPAQPLFDEAGLKEYYGGEVPSEGSVYFKAGTDGNKDIIIFSIVSNGIGNANGVAVKDGTSYKIIQKNSAGLFGEDGTYYGPKLAAGVSVDTTTAYDGLTPKDTLTYNGVTASRSSEWAIETDMADATEVAKTADGVVYERIYSLEGQQGIKQYYILLKQPSHTYVKYRYTTSVLKDDNTATVNWKDGSSTTGAYQWAMVWGGCGSIGSVNVLDKAYFGDLIEAGKTNGQTVYTLNSATHPVMNTIYKNYNADGTLPGAPTQQQMFDDKGVIVVRNELGYRVVLVSDKYQRAGECGKPVIYLYPESPTALSVKVGANVTKSEPLYGNGWDVFAMPDGKLLTSGGTYDSLFWEGIGQGNYPQITEGFVVKRSKVEKTLWQHLQQLGLNQKESADFMEFWMPLMPDTQYVRLTWFGTQQMNELAPLMLSEKPDTTIRIFLDFEGLDTKIALPTQRLSHPDRKGFVVVEWGGLLTTR
jgi:hypothetical protein